MTKLFTAICGALILLLPLGGAASAIKTLRNADVLIGDVDTLDPQDVRERTDRSKVQLGGGATAEISGLIQASDGLAVNDISNWADDLSPYGISFTGSGIVKVELPSST